MQIFTNLASLNVQNYLARSSADSSRAIQRLSSGLRVNSASDDAAGLAIGSRMQSQISGNRQAARNANDALSLLQTAEGAVGSAMEMLQRMRELAVQGANGTLSASDRQSLQLEITQNLAGIDRIATDTEFNSQKIFVQPPGGGYANPGDADKAAVLQGLKTGWLEDAEQLVQSMYGLIADGTLTMDVNLSWSDGAGNVAASVSTTFVGADGEWKNISLNIDMADFTPPNLPSGGNAPFYNDRIIAHELAHAIMSQTMNFMALPTWFKEGAAEFIHGAKERVQIDAFLAGGAATLVANNNISTWAGDSAHYSTAYSAVRYLHDKLQTAGVAGGIKDVMSYLSSNAGSTLDNALNALIGGTYANTAAFVADWQANGAAYINSNVLVAGTDTGAIGNADADGGPSVNADDIIPDTGTKTGDQVLDGFLLNFPVLASNSGASSPGDYVFQIGANQGDTLTLQPGVVHAAALGVDTVNISTQSGAGSAITAIDHAMDALSTQRATYGASMNRLESAISSLTGAADNLAAARSRIMDADYAQETSRLTRTQIMMQAATAMLAKANAAPNMALTLLKTF
jgi:flagellin